MAKESLCSDAQLCPTLCDPTDCISPGPSVHEIFQARILDNRSFSKGSSPRDLPHPGIEPGSPALQADSLPTEPPGKPQKKA